ncbi:MAG: serine hydrolase domain-containing protein, partial [Aquabacterium sp.]
MTDAIAQLLQHQIAESHCPGALAHVEASGRVLARHAAGVIRPDDAAPMHDGVRFRIASLTKPMVTLAALMLADEGRLDIDAPVHAYLPALTALRMPDGQPPPRAPTVRDLMRHTSGLAYPYEIADAAVRAAWLAAGLAPGSAGLDSAALLARLAQLPLAAAPGTAFRYGYSTDVLGCMVERLEGVRLAEVLQRRLFGPLGMRQTGFEET